MDGYKYVDIFATKGVEYLVVLAFLAILVFFWRWMSKHGVVETAKEKIKKSISLIDWFYLKNDYYYHQGHSWAAPEKSGIVTVGVDDFTQKFLGKPAKISLPSIGDKVMQGENSIKFQIDSKSIDILSPVEGEVVEINSEVLNNPEIVNKDPYLSGWLFKVKAPRLRKNLHNLLSGKLAKAWMEETVEKVSKTMTADVGIVMQDGGVPVSGFVKEISIDNWEDIAKEYLLTND